MATWRSIGGVRAAATRPPPPPSLRTGPPRGALRVDSERRREVHDPDERWVSGPERTGRELGRLRHARFRDWRRVPTFDRAAVERAVSLSATSLSLSPAQAWACRSAGCA